MRQQFFKARILSALRQGSKGNWHGIACALVASKQRGRVVNSKKHTCHCQCLNDVPDRGGSATTRRSNADFSHHVILGNPNLDLGVTPLRHLDGKRVRSAIAVLHSGCYRRIVEIATRVFEIR